jgi:hypothetical protein
LYLLVPSASIQNGGSQLALLAGGARVTGAAAGVSVASVDGGPSGLRAETALVFETAGTVLLCGETEADADGRGSAFVSAVWAATGFSGIQSGVCAATGFSGSHSDEAEVSGTARGGGALGASTWAFFAGDDGRATIE